MVSAMPDLLGLAGAAAASAAGDTAAVTSCATGPFKEMLRIVLMENPRLESRPASRGSPTTGERAEESDERPKSFSQFCFVNKNQEAYLATRAS